MPRANAQPVRLSNDVLDATKQVCALSGRSLPMEIEHRLKGSLQRGAWADVEQHLAGDARAFGRLVSLLANELGLGVKPGGEDALKAAVGYLLDRMYGEPRDPIGQTEMITDVWWLRLCNSHERTYENGTPISMTSEQRALVEIRSDVATGRVGAAEKPEDTTTGGLEKQAKDRQTKKRKAA